MTSSSHLCAGCSHECAPLLVRSGRPSKEGRAAKSPKVPRTLRAPTHLNGVTVPSCTLPLATPALFDGRLSVRAAFRGATLLLTGGTGFVGSVVLEQLLRVQPDVERIFVIIRAKRSVPGALLSPTDGAAAPPAQGAQDCLSMSMHA